MAVTAQVQRKVALRSSPLTPSALVCKAPLTVQQHPPRLPLGRAPSFQGGPIRHRPVLCSPAPGTHNAQRAPSTSSRNSNARAPPCATHVPVLISKASGTRGPRHTGCQRGRSWIARRSRAAGLRAAEGRAPPQNRPLATAAPGPRPLAPARPHVSGRPHPEVPPRPSNAARPDSRVPRLGPACWGLPRSHGRARPAPRAPAAPACPPRFRPGPAQTQARPPAGRSPQSSLSSRPPARTPLGKGGRRARRR